MSTTIVDKPIEVPTNPTIELNITDEETCYLCEHRGKWECDYCERLVCRHHLIELPQWCAFHLGICPECHAKKQEEEN